MKKRISELKQIIWDGTIYNTLDGCLFSTKMYRIFQKESLKDIRDTLINEIIEFCNVKTQLEFNRKRSHLIRFFISHITQRGVKRSPASYGQAAKVVDLMLCHLFYQSFVRQKRIIPWLYPAIDNVFLRYLKDNYKKKFPKNATSLKNIDKKTWMRLQHLILIDIDKEFQRKIRPVEWDILRWRELARKREES
jgi:hypothetical protein